MNNEVEQEKEMARRPLSQMGNWELVHEEDDVRGKDLLDDSGKRIGTVSELMLDTDAGRVTSIVLDSGDEYPVDSIDIRDGQPYLRSGYGAGYRGGTTPDELTVPIAEERLRIRERQVKTGEAGIRKEVVTERETRNVPVSHEEVYVEERSVEPRPSDRPIGEGETRRVPVYEEEVTAEKETVVTGEAHIGKKRVEETQPISEELRKERVRVEHEGDVEVHESDEERRRRAA